VRKSQPVYITLPSPLFHACTNVSCTITLTPALFFFSLNFHWKFHLRFTISTLFILYSRTSFFRKVVSDGIKRRIQNKSLIPCKTHNPTSHENIPSYLFASRCINLHFLFPPTVLRKDSFLTIHSFFFSSFSFVTTLYRCYVHLFYFF